MSNVVRLIALSLLMSSCTAETAPASQTGDASQDAASPGTDRIAIAMSGAPRSITSAATIMDFDESGTLVELRPGTNGWMCIPDDAPAAPGDAPMCMDRAWQQWLDAYMNQQTPGLSGVGISYMLQGGPAASNTDPYAEAPAEGEDWIQDPPHMMVIVPDPSMLDGFPTDPESGEPYVMWKGTPYAHLMVPVADK